MSGTPAPTAAPNAPYSIGALEGAGVAFLGAFAGAYAATGSIGSSLVAGAASFTAFLGYHAYQSG